jgi:hypothetical protein
MSHLLYLLRRWVKIAPKYNKEPQEIVKNGNGMFFSFSYKIILNKSTILKLIGLSNNGEGSKL